MRCEKPKHFPSSISMMKMALHQTVTPGTLDSSCDAGLRFEGKECTKSYRTSVAVTSVVSTMMSCIFSLAVVVTVQEKPCGTCERLLRMNTWEKCYRRAAGGLCSSQLLYYSQLFSVITVRSLTVL